MTATNRIVPGNAIDAMMGWLSSLFDGSTVTGTLVIAAIVAIAGLALGQVQVGGVPEPCPTSAIFSFAFSRASLSRISSVLPHVDREEIETRGEHETTG